MKKKLFLFDICWTLFSCNTTFLFVEYCTQNSQLKRVILKMAKNKFCKFIMAILNKLGFDLERFLYIYLLRGFTETDLRYRALSFYNDVLNFKKIHPVIELLNRRLELHDRVILCSASLDVIVQVISSKYSVDFISSKLEFKKGVCTGFLSKDILHKKSDSIKDQIGDLAVDYVITDNKSDIDLLDISQSFFVIPYGNTQFWLDIQSKFREKIIILDGDFKFDGIL